MQISFAGKQILVTGAGEAIGKVLIYKLLECSAKVLAIDQSRILLEALKKEKPAVEIAEVNLSDWDATRKILHSIESVDGLVNNAGMITLEPFLRVKPENFDRVFSVNVRSLFNINQVICRKMVEAKTGGSIVNVTTHASKIGFRDRAVLCASRGSIDALTRNMAVELGPFKIRVNTVNPTMVMTGMGKLAWADAKSGAPLQSKIPMGRFGDAEEVVNTILFLLSDKASFITGTSIPIDGGYNAAAK